MNEVQNTNSNPDEETQMGLVSNQHTQMTQNLGQDCTDDFMQIQRIFDEKYQDDEPEAPQITQQQSKNQSTTPDTSPLTNLNEAKGDKKIRRILVKQQKQLREFEQDLRTLLKIVKNGHQHQMEQYRQVNLQNKAHITNQANLSHNVLTNGDKFVNQEEIYDLAGNTNLSPQVQNFTRFYDGSCSNEAGLSQMQAPQMQPSLILQNQMTSVPPTTNVGYNGLDVLKSHRSNFQQNVASNSKLIKKQSFKSVQNYQQHSYQTTNVQNKTSSATQLIMVQNEPGEEEEKVHKDANFEKLQELEKFDQFKGQNIQNNDNTQSGIFQGLQQFGGQPINIGQLFNNSSIYFGAINGPNGGAMTSRSPTGIGQRPKQRFSVAKMGFGGRMGKSHEGLKTCFISSKTQDEKSTMSGQCNHKVNQINSARDNAKNNLKKVFSGIPAHRYGTRSGDGSKTQRNIGNHDRFQQSPPQAQTDLSPKSLNLIQQQVCLILDKLQNFKKQSAKKLKKVKKKLGDPVKDNRGSKTHRSRRQKNKNRSSQNRPNPGHKSQISEVQSSLSYSSLDEGEDSPEPSPLINNLSQPLVNNHHLRIKNLNTNYQPKLQNLFSDTQKKRDQENLRTNIHNQDPEANSSTPFLTINNDTDNIMHLSKDLPINMKINNFMIQDGDTNFFSADDEVRNGGDQIQIIQNNIENNNFQYGNNVFFGLNDNSIKNEGLSFNNSSSATFLNNDESYHDFQEFEQYHHKTSKQSEVKNNDNIDMGMEGTPQKQTAHNVLNFYQNVKRYSPVLEKNTTQDILVDSQILEPDAQAQEQAERPSETDDVKIVRIKSNLMLNDNRNYKSRQYVQKDIIQAQPFSRALIDRDSKKMDEDDQQLIMMTNTFQNILESKEKQQIAKDLMRGSFKTSANGTNIKVPMLNLGKIMDSQPKEYYVEGSNSNQIKTQGVSSQNTHGLPSQSASQVNILQKKAIQPENQDLENLEKVEFYGTIPSNQDEVEQPACNITGITVTDDVITGFNHEGENAQSPPPFDGQVLAKGEDTVNNVVVSISYDSRLPFSPSREREERDKMINFGSFKNESVKSKDYLLSDIQLKNTNPSYKTQNVRDLLKHTSNQINGFNKAKSAKVEPSRRIFGFFEQKKEPQKEDDGEISSPLFPCSGITSRLDASKSKEFLSPILNLESKKDEITNIDEFQELQNIVDEGNEKTIKMQALKLKNLVRFLDHDKEKRAQNQDLQGKNAKIQEFLANQEKIIKSVPIQKLQDIRLDKIKKMNATNSLKFKKIIDEVSHKNLVQKTQRLQLKQQRLLSGTNPKSATHQAHSARSQKGAQSSNQLERKASDKVINSQSQQKHLKGSDSLKQIKSIRMKSSKQLSIKNRIIANSNGQTIQGSRNDFQVVYPKVSQKNLTTAKLPEGVSSQKKKMPKILIEDVNTEYVKKARPRHFLDGGVSNEIIPLSCKNSNFAKADFGFSQAIKTERDFIEGKYQTQVLKIQQDTESKSGSKESSSNRYGNLTYRRKYKNYNHLGQPRAEGDPKKSETNSNLNEYHMFKTITTIEKIEQDSDVLYSARNPIFNNGPVKPGQSGESLTARLSPGQRVPQVSQSKNQGKIQIRLRPSEKKGTEGIVRFISDDAKGKIEKMPIVKLKRGQVIMKKSGEAQTHRA